MQLLMLRQLFLSSLLILVPSCVFAPKPKAHVAPKTDVLAPWVHIAQLVDIPPAPGAHILQVNRYEHDNGTHYYLTLSVQGPLEAVLSFYHEEMDNLGWQEVMVSSRANELAMIYLKPSRICMIHAHGDEMRIVVAPNGTYIPEKALTYHED